VTGAKPTLGTWAVLWADIWADIWA